MKKITLVVSVFIFTLLVGCSSINSTELPTLTIQPPTQTPTITPTSTPRPTNTPIPTPTPVYVTLGSPFASDCGDGVPVIWSNDSFNGKFRADGFG